MQTSSLCGRLCTCTRAPCCKKVRAYLKAEFLKKSGNSIIEDKDAHLIGFNASSYKRNIVWVGKVRELMTFEYAYNNLSKDRNFSELNSLNDSPLHLKPLYKNGDFIGYEHISEKHEDSWVWDLVEGRRKKASETVLDPIYCF